MSHDDEEDAAVEGNEDKTNYITGLKLHLITVALCLSLFLTNFEIPVVSTSLVAIANDLGGFTEAPWIILSYLLAYLGFLIIWAKVSDIFGRKYCLVTAVAIFTIFSGVCGAAQTTLQLIIFRAFQGFGGSGTYALSMVIFFELVPPAKYATYTSLVAAMFAVSYMLGPIIGGVINNAGDDKTWRWVFLLNAPAGPCALAVLILAIPSDFPFQGQVGHKKRGMKEVFSMESFRRLDMLGALLLLAASVLLVTALQEAGINYAWNSPLVIAFLAVSTVCWIVFFAWEWGVTRANGIREPVFPWRFFENRMRIGLILVTFLVGVPYTVAVIQIPQKFQNANGLSPLGAGLRLLPYTGSSQIGSMVAAKICGRFKIPLLYMGIFGSILQVIGFALLSTIPTANDIHAYEYGYEVLAGAGAGITVVTMILITPFTVEPQDRAVAQGAIAQLRLMGGTIGLGVVTTVFNSYLTPKLAGLLTPEQIAALLQTSEIIDTFPPATAAVVRDLFSHGYNLQMRILIGTGAAQIPAALLMWQKKQILV